MQEHVGSIVKELGQNSEYPSFGLDLVNTGECREGLEFGSKIESHALGRLTL